jgi:hypothetical protein
MPKRSRYEHVTILDGQVQIYASDLMYTFETIKRWDAYELACRFNPENIDYMLNVFCASGDHLIRCRDQTEMVNIMDELSDQGI